jgi:RHS repeat-associated protein
MLATDKGGNTSWKARAESFGKVVSESGTLQLNLRFPGQYHDQETGTHYNFHRDYSPNTGRYLQSDPIGLRGGSNLYIYVNNTPVVFVDPKGLVKWEGEVYSLAGIYYGGAARYWFDLVSECVDGKYDFILVSVFTFALGLGLEVTGSGTAIKFDDHLNYLNPYGFDGGFRVVSAGIGFILTGGYSYMLLGDNVSEIGFKPTPGIGVDASVFLGAGFSTVTEVNTFDCSCIPAFQRKPCCSSR